MIQYKKLEGGTGCGLAARKEKAGQRSADSELRSSPIRNELFGDQIREFGTRAELDYRSRRSKENSRIPRELRDGKRDAEGRDLEQMSLTVWATSWMTLAGEQEGLMMPIGPLPEVLVKWMCCSARTRRPIREVLGEGEGVSLEEEKQGEEKSRAGRKNRDREWEKERKKETRRG